MVELVALGIGYLTQEQGHVLRLKPLLLNTRLLGVASIGPG